MTDYNKYLAGLMADCQNCVQCPSYQPQHPHISPQYLATSPTPLRFTFKEPKGTVPRPIISGDLPAPAAATAAFTPKNSSPADTAPRPHALETRPPPIAGPRPEAPRDLTVDPHPASNKKVPHAANAPRSTISGALSPVATAPSPFVPLFQLPIATSISAGASRKAHEPTTPTGHGRPRQDTGKGCIKEEPDKGFRTHYKNMYQDAMRKELKARGLLCHGPNADLVKRLEQDDAFQAEPRTVENYDTMSLKEIRSLCVRRSIPSHGIFASLKDRLKAHDKRESRVEAVVPGLGALSVSSGRLSVLEEKNRKEILQEVPLVPTVKGEPAAVTETTDPVNDLPSNVRERSLSKTDITTKYGYEEAKRLSQRAVRRAEVEDGQLQAKRGGIFQEMAETVTPAKPIKCIEPKTMTGRQTSCSHCRRRKRRCTHDLAETVTPAKPIKCIEPKTMTGRQTSCSHCRRRKRRCIHDLNGNKDPIKTIEPARAIKPATPIITTTRLRPSRPKVSASENDGKRRLATPEVAPQSMTRLRLSHPRVSASENDKKPLLAIDELAGARVTRSRVSDPKASASQSESRRPARTGRVPENVKRIDNMPKSKRTQLLFQPKDEIILLQICVKLKDVISWGKIHGFWIMVQDTLQLKTGKEYKKVSRHVEILVRKRRAEKQEIEQRGKISISRVSAGCRPLLDKWIAGGNFVHHSSPNISTTPSSIEDEDDMSLDEEVTQQLDSDDLALEVQKRSATDAWLDTTCDTTRCKKVKLCISEPTSGTSKSCADSIGCWSLSGSSVTSESSLEDDSEDRGENENEHDLKNGDCYPTTVKSGSAEDLVNTESNVKFFGLPTNPSPIDS